MHIAKSSFAFWNFLEFFSQIFFDLRLVESTGVESADMDGDYTGFYASPPPAHTCCSYYHYHLSKQLHHFSNCSHQNNGTSLDFSLFLTLHVQSVRKSSWVYLQNISKSNHFSIPPLLPPDLTHHHHFPGLLNKPHISTLFPLCTYSLFSS